MIVYNEKTKQIVVSEFFDWDFISDRIEVIKEWAKNQIKEFGPGDSNFTPYAKKLIAWNPSEAERADVMKQIAEDMDTEIWSYSDGYNPEMLAENAVVNFISETFGLDIDASDVYEGR